MKVQASSAGSTAGSFGQPPMRDIKARQLTGAASERDSTVSAVIVSRAAERLSMESLQSHAGTAKIPSGAKALVILLDLCTG